MSAVSELLADAASVLGMIARGTVQLVTDSTLLQQLQIRLSQGSTEDEDDLLSDVEHWHPYGFTNVPKPADANGAPEALVLHVDASDEHPVVIAVADRRYRLTALADGDVAIYNDRGSKVHIKVDRIVVEAPIIELGDGATESVIKGDAFKILFDAHTHSGVTAGVGATGPPAVGITTELSAVVQTK